MVVVLGGFRHFYGLIYKAVRIFGKCRLCVLHVFSVFISVFCYFWSFFGPFTPWCSNMLLCVIYFNACSRRPRVAAHCVQSASAATVLHVHTMVDCGTLGSQRMELPIATITKQQRAGLSAHPTIMAAWTVQ